MLIETLERVAAQRRTTLTLDDIDNTGMRFVREHLSISGHEYLMLLAAAHRMLAERFPDEAEQIDTTSQEHVMRFIHRNYEGGLTHFREKHGQPTATKQRTRAQHYV